MICVTQLVAAFFHAIRCRLCFFDQAPVIFSSIHRAGRILSLASWFLGHGNRVDGPIEIQP